MATPSVPGLAGGRYVITGELGHGGQARVWRAQDTLLHRDVAIKEMLPMYGLTDDERAQARERVLREARAMVRVDHPNVVRVYDVIDAGADPLIVMEYVPGRNLRTVLSGDGLLDLAATTRIGADVLQALRAAHQEGVLHRDVKPDNILIRPDGRLVLTDFGIAKVVGYQETRHSGRLSGTPAYLAPERIRGEDASAGADLWALGVTLYACLTGDSPFARPEVYPTLLAVAEQPVDVPAEWGSLGTVIGRLLQKNPADRPDVAEAARLLGGAPAGTIPLPAPPRRRPRRVLGLLVVLVLLAGVGGVLGWQLRTPADPQLRALQAFAGNQRIVACQKIGPLDDQATRRECRGPGDEEVYWILYGLPGDDPAQAAARRDAHYASDVKLRKAGSLPCACQIHEGSGPDGSRGHYVEYTYRASDDGREWVSIWWDDDLSHPGGTAALNIRRPYDGSADPAAPLRNLWLDWNYRFTDKR